MTIAVLRAATALLLLWCGPAWSEATQSVATGQFTIATVNCRGLPAWISRDDPVRRLPLLLNRVAPFNVVLLQEDFAYQSLVDAHSRQPSQVRGNTGEGNGLLRAGDGLTLLTDLKMIGAPVHGGYAICHGWFGGANDCFSDKGYLMQRLAVTSEASVDVWTTHLDAGSSDADRAVRDVQLDRLAIAMNTHSRGLGMIVGGDFNLNWNDARDREVMHGWLARTGLSIAVLTPVPARVRRVDYLLVRSSSTTSIACDDGGVVPDLVDPGGAPLTNHPALQSTCTISSFGDEYGKPSASKDP